MGSVEELQTNESTDLATMLDAGDAALVTLSAGDTRLVVHRAVLAARSRVFETMICLRSGRITVTNVEGPVLRQLLAYCYTLQAPKLHGSAPQLLAAAEKFCLSGPKALCDRKPVEEFRETEAVDLAALLDAGDHATVTLSAGETLLVAHRAVLAARSFVFEVMFSADVLEARRGSFAIPDVEGPVLRQLLAYIYTLQAPQLPSMAPQMLVAADKYCLWGLKAACERQMCAHLDVENAAATAELAVRHRCPTLWQATVTFIRAHTHQVMMTQGWLDTVVGHPHSAMELIRLIAEPEPPAETRSCSPEEKYVRLIEAALEGTEVEVRALVAAGADAEAVSRGKWTALHYTADGGHVGAVRRLLAAGAPVDARQELQETPLHQAAMCGHTAVVWLLLGAGADLDARDVFGWTPLHVAASYGCTEVAAALLEAGADKGARDSEGLSPLCHATIHNHRQLMDLLR